MILLVLLIVMAIVIAVAIIVGCLSIALPIADVIVFSALIVLFVKFIKKHMKRG